MDTLKILYKVFYTNRSMYQKSGTMAILKQKNTKIQAFVNSK